MKKTIEITGFMEDVKKIQVISFMNAFSEGVSGGDAAFIEVFKRINLKNHLILTSSLGEKLCRQMGLDAQFVLTTREREFSSVIITYALRIIVGSVQAFFLPIPNVIYVSSDILPDVIPAICLKIKASVMRRKVIVFQKFFHLNQKSRFISYYMQIISIKLMNLYADRVSTCSSISAGVIQHLGVKEDLVKINHLGVDDELISESEPLNEVFDAVFIGRLHESKGIFDIVPGWQKIVDKLPNATLGVVGMADRVFKETFECQIRKEQLEKNIKFLGYRAGKDAYAYLKSSKVFFFPSHEEGFGIVLAEAMTAGSAVVAYDLEVYKETFGSSIYTVKCFDYYDFADKVLCLLQDENLRLNIVSRAKEIAKKFTWSNCAKREYMEISKTYTMKIKLSPSEVMKATKKS